MGLLNGKIAVITGAGGGIGRSHALLFAKEGAKVVVNDLGTARDGTGASTNAADSVAAEIRASGGEAVANYDSVATFAGGARIIQAALDAFGRIDILVNNAGILRDKSILKMTEEEWDLVLGTHLKGTFACSQPALRWMKENGVKGRVINTTSFSGLIGNFGQANYAAAKAGIFGFTNVASVEFKKYGITVNAIAPVAKTRMTEDLPMFQSIPDEVLGPQYISPVALFLASDLSRDVTGRILGVRGRHIFLYKMLETTPLDKEEAPWTAEEIAAQWEEIERGE